jgi:two-component system sensor histidine kinase AlgZ
MKASRTYWVCQLAGWTIYAAVNAALFLSATPDRAAAAAIITCMCALGLVYSHGYRRLIHRRGWLRLGPLALLPRALATSVALAALFEASVALISRAISPSTTWGTATPQGIALTLINFSILFFCWQLIYFGVHLFERSRTLEVERWQLAAAAQGAELRYLKAQINPHFLFNCLNSLRALIAENPAGAQAMVTRLASLLRYALGTAHDQLVPLERELAVVQDYLALEGARLESRLRARFEVAAECRPVLVPPMMVQMLVENGIKHGIAQRTDGGEILIAARMSQEALELAVTNTAAAAPARADGEGIGLANARDRLQLLYGGRAELRLERLPTATTASLRIPFG